MKRTRGQCSLCPFTHLSSPKQSDKHPHWTDNATWTSLSILHFAVFISSLAQVGLKLLGSGDSPASGSQVAGTTCWCHYFYLRSRFLAMKGGQVDKRLKVLSLLLEELVQNVVCALVPQLPQYPAAPSALRPSPAGWPLPLCISLTG